MFTEHVDYGAYGADDDDCAVGVDDGTYDDDNEVFAGWCNVQARSTVLRRSNRFNFGSWTSSYLTPFILHPNF